jgi:transglutaminase-like putative cysteine protease
MQILKVRHITRYRYARPVRFGEHRIMLRPREDSDQEVLFQQLSITPEPSELELALDELGNWVAVARFDSAAHELRFENEVRVARAPAPQAVGVPPGLIRSHAAAPPQPETADDPDGAVLGWASAFLARPAPDLDALGAMTRAIHAGFDYRRRLEPGVQPAWLTLELKSGACRDFAVLMIAAARALGLNARFASGYVHAEAGGGGGHTHAWACIEVPGHGWTDFDPTSGKVGAEGLVRVALADEPVQAIPIQGVFFGDARDFLAMDVEVDIRAEAAPGRTEPVGRPGVAIEVT